MNLLEKEQLYLECCAAWNVEKKQVISDDEFEDLKSDLTFEGSQVEFHTPYPLSLSLCPPSLSLSLSLSL